MAHFIFLLLSLIPALATALQFPGEDGPSELNTALYQNIMYMMAIRQYMSVMMHIPLDKKYWMDCVTLDPSKIKAIPKPQNPMPYPDKALYVDLSDLLLAVYMLLPEGEIPPEISRLNPCTASVENPQSESPLDTYKMLVAFLEDDFFHELLRGIQITSDDYRPRTHDDYIAPNKTSSELLNKFGDQAGLGEKAGENILGMLQISRFLLYGGVLQHHRHCNVTVPASCDQPGNMKELRDCWAKTPGSSGKSKWLTRRPGR